LWLCRHMDHSVFQYKYTMLILMYLNNVVKIADDLTHMLLLINELSFLWVG